MDSSHISTLKQIMNKQQKTSEFVFLLVLCNGFVLFRFFSMFRMPSNIAFYERDNDECSLWTALPKDHLRLSSGWIGYVSDQKIKLFLGEIFAVNMILFQ